MARLSRAWAITRRILQQLRNDKRTLGLVISFPVIFSLLFGLAFAGEVVNLGVAFVNDDEGYLDTNISNAIIDNLLNDSRLLLVNKTGITLEEAELFVVNGIYQAIIYFPPNFTQNLFLGDEANITVYLDGTEPTIASAILDAVHDAFETELREQRGLEFVFTYVYGGPDVRLIDFIAPAIIPFVMNTVILMLTAIFVVRDRLNGTLSRMLATQATKFDIILGFGMAISIVGVFQSTIILFFTIFMFNVTVQGSILLAYIFSVLYAIVSLSLGLMLSAWAANELQALQFIPLIIFPSILISGFLIPIELLPWWLQPLAYFFPLTYGIHGLREIMIRGTGLEAIWPDILALLLFMCLFISLALKFFREE